jgi:membrane associated rhomboid family serine protease
MKATLGLILLNVGAFVLMALGGVSLMDPSADSLIAFGADYGPLTLNGQSWRMCTSLFLHFGVIHLLINMIVLANIGPFVETLSGSAAFVTLYLVAGFGGSAGSLAWHPWTVSAGASGAIFGLYGALLAFLLRYRDSIEPEALAPLRKGAIVFVGYNLLYGLFRPDVDMAAHVGGLIAGFLLGLFLVQPVSEEAPAVRGGRISAAAVLGLLLVVGTVYGFPKPDDLRCEIKRMSQMEDKALALYNSSIEKWKADQLTDLRFTRIVEQEVLPPWRAERESLAKMKRLSGEQTQLATSLIQYMKAREDGWDLLVDGVRTNDMGKLQRANQKGQEADAPG